MSTPHAHPGPSTPLGMTAGHTTLLLLLVAITAELWEAGYDWNPTLPDRLMYPRTPLLETMDELKRASPEDGPFRVVANGPIFFPNLSAVYGLEDVRAHDPMANAQYINLLRLLVGYDAGNYFAPWPDLETHFLDYLNVRYLITSPGAEMRDSRWALRYDGRDGRIFENGTVLPRFYPVRNVIIDFNDNNFYHRLRDMNDKWPHTGLLEKLELESQQQHDDFFNARAADAPAAEAEILEAGPSGYRIHVRAPRYTLMVSSVPFWPGWKVDRNGARAEALRVNGGFLGFAVPPGELDVRVWYDPWSFRYGLIIAAATVVGLLAFGLRHHQPSQP